MDFDSNTVDPSQVRLVVEVISASSRSHDRILKPAQYAAAGIPGYWRIETEDGVSLTAYGLRGEVYIELSTWIEGETVELAHTLRDRLCHQRFGAAEFADS